MHSSRRREARAYPWPWLLLAGAIGWASPAVATEGGCPMRGATDLCLPVSSHSTELPKTAYAAVDNANLRDAPSRDGQSVARLPLATRVEVLAPDRTERIGARTDTWYKVRATTAEGERQGYMFGTTLTPHRLVHDLDEDGVAEVLVAAFNGAGELVLRLRDAADPSAPVAWGKWGEAGEPRENERVTIEVVPATTAGLPLLFFELPDRKTEDSEECYEARSWEFLVLRDAADGSQTLASELWGVSAQTCGGDSQVIARRRFDAATRTLTLSLRDTAEQEGYRETLTEESKTFRARKPAFAAVSRTGSAREVAAAEALRAELKTADAAVASSGGGGGAVTAGKAGIEWVSLGAFEMSKTEVTVAQYRACVEAGTCTAPDTGAYCNWDKSGREDHPINCVDWNQATTFAKWAGGRLPTGEEWTYAATSGGQSWDYPWGDETATCDRAIMDDGGRGCGQDRTWPVCSKPAGNSRQGVCDLAGNVYEWTDQRRGAPIRGYRGGGWYNIASDLRASNRGWVDLSNRGNYLGFRLAR